MAETIISQLDRAFANPLETNRQVNFISDRDAISALKRWEGMQVYVKSELTTYELRGGILNEHWTDISGIDSANYLPTGGYAGTAQDIVDSIELTTSGIEIISVTHIINLDYYVVANPYKINSEYYSASPTTVTLTTGDATDARIDVIYADINGVIGVLEGTPAPSPIKPIVDPNTQRELTFRTVPALATVDPMVTNELVFDENVGTVGGEFDVDGWNLTALDFNNTAVAFSGSKSIYFDGVDPYFNVDFKNDVNIAVSGLSSFYFRVYVTEVLDRNASFFFHCLDTSFVATGSSRTVKDGLFGFDRNVLNTWQLISIPIAFFNLPVAEIKGIRFMVSSIKKPKMYIDTMAFQFNVAQPAPLVNPLRFTQLTDTPNTYTGQAGKVATVNATETGLEFNTPIGTGDMLKSIYDPTNINSDAFATDNFKNATVAKTTPIDADNLTLWDSVSSSFKKVTWANIKATLKTYFDTLYATVAMAKTEYMLYACSDEITDLVLGDAISIRMPYAMTLSEVRISLNEAPTITKFIADVKEGGVSIFSTLPSIDTTELTSVTASVPAVISDTALADNALLVVSVTQLGSGDIGKGFKILFIGQRS